VFGILHGIALFIIIRGLFQHHEDWAHFFGVSLVASLFVALYAFAQVNPVFRFFSVVEAKEIQPGSTFGHQSFVATYAIFHLFFGLFVLLLNKGTRWRILAAISIAMNLILFGLTAVRGAQIAMMASVAVGIILSSLFIVKNTRTRIALAGVLVISGGLFAAVIALKESPLVNKLPYAFQRMATISPDAATARTRLISLGVSWEAFKERPLTGWGQEHFATAYNKHFDPEHLTYEQAWFDRAHNKVADVAVQNGILGVIAYLGMFVIGLVGLVRRLRTAGENSRTQWVMAGVIMLGTAYFVQNLFLFDTTTSTMLFFASLGFAGWLIDGAGAETIRRPRKKISRTMIRVVPVTAGVVTIGVMIWGNWFPYSTARLGRESLASKDPGKTHLLYARALESGGFPAAEVTRAMMDEMINAGRVQRPEWRRVTEAVSAQAAELSDGEYPSVPFLVRLGKLYNEQWQRESGSLLMGERVLRKALSLAPNHPDAYYELGVTLLRQGKSEQGLALFQSALNLNTGNARARWTLGLALMSVGRADQGLVEIEEALDRGYNWDTPADIKNLTAVYESLQRQDRMVWLYEQVVMRHPGLAENHARLAMAYAQTGAHEKGKEQIMIATQIDRRYEPYAAEFIRNLRSSTTVQRSHP
jgi:O-antigen ligase